MKILTSKGISLISVMVALGIASGLTLTIMQSSKNTMKLKKNISDRSESRIVLYRLTQNLSSVRNCNLNFKKGETPKLVDSKKLFKETIKGGLVDIETFLDIEKEEKVSSGIIVKSMTLLLSKTDSVGAGLTAEENSSKDIHGYAELKIEFGKNLNKGISYKKMFYRTIPIFLNLNSAFQFESCYASALNELLQKAVADAVKQSCGLGLVFNDDISNPTCIPASDELVLAECPEGQYIENIKLINSSGDIKYEPTCGPKLCQKNEIGIWFNNGMSCVKCASDQLPVITNSGVKCQNLECSSSSSSIEYFAGIDSITGEKQCRTLVDSANPICGPNGFKLIMSSIEGSVSGKCCTDCPDTSQICSGLVVSKTADCNISCTGTMARAPMNYDTWGPCTPKTNGGVCTQERSGKCIKLDKNGFPCCEGGKEVDTIERTCSTGGWSLAACPKNSLETTVIEPVCSTRCCDPAKRPSSVVCSPETAGGAKFAQCNVVGGVFRSMNGKVYCKIPGNCPVVPPNHHYPVNDPRGYKWTRIWWRHEAAHGKGDSWGICDDEDECRAPEKLQWHQGDSPRCSYYAVRKYVFPWCKFVNRTTAYGRTIESLCE